MANIPIEFFGGKIAGDTLDNVIYDLTQKTRGLDKFIDSTIEKNGGFILQKIKLRLWNKGIGGDGLKLINSESKGKKWRQKYAMWKKRMGYRSSPVNLRLTGAFWDSMKVFSRKGIVTIKASDEKTPLLIRKFGENILTLTDEEQLWVVRTIVEPAVTEFLGL